jgi:hypothetical protein
MSLVGLVERFSLFGSANLSGVYYGIRSGDGET